jgi:O-antigen ligase
VPFLHLSFLLFVVSTLVSQSALDFFSTLFCLSWCWNYWKQDRRAGSRFLNPVGVEYYFLAWFVVSIIGFLLNWNDTSYALQRILEFRWILILYVMFEILNDIRPDERIKKFFFGFSFFIALTNLAIYFTDIPELNSMRYGYRDHLVRAGGFYADPMTFAHLFVLWFSFLLGLCLFCAKEWQEKFRKWAFLTMGLCLLSLILTFTRGVLIGFGLSLFFGIFIWKPKYLGRVLIAILLSCGGLYLLTDSFKTRFDQTVSEAMGASERKMIWAGHFQIFKENPIFGAGYGQNTKALPRVYLEMGAPPDTLVSHAHNQYLHLAAGTGILGLLSYLLIWFFFLKLNLTIWAQRHLSPWDRGAAWGLLVGQLSFLIAGLTEANFEHSKVRFMVMLSWAYVIFLANKYKLLKLKSEVRTL